MVNVNLNLSIIIITHGKINGRATVNLKINLLDSRTNHSSRLKKRNDKKKKNDNKRAKVKKKKKASYDNDTKKGIPNAINMHEKDVGFFLSVATWNIYIRLFY